MDRAHSEDKKGLRRSGEELTDSEQFGGVKLAQAVTEEQAELGVVAHACNPIYSGGRDQEDAVQSQPRPVVHKALS
jgi:hypothetical protein